MARLIVKTPIRTEHNHVCVIEGLSPNQVHDDLNAAGLTNGVIHGVDLSALSDSQLGELFPGMTKEEAQEGLHVVCSGVDRAKVKAALPDGTVISSPAASVIVMSGTTDVAQQVKTVGTTYADIGDQTEIALPTVDARLNHHFGAAMSTYAANNGEAENAFSLRGITRSELADALSYHDEQKGTSLADSAKIRPLYHPQDE